MKSHYGSLDNINQLPKDKLILDYVLARLSATSSPERFEMISGIFNMYRTSTGFDPMSISKGRYKRMKSGDFRKTLVEIEADLDVVIQSEPYRQLVAKQHNFNDLFQSYSQLSEALSIHPFSSMTSEVEEFESTLKRKEAYEILLNFYHYHPNFFENTRNGDQLDNFLNDFDAIAERAQHRIKHTRITFLLPKLEQLAANGKLDLSLVNKSFEELELLLLSENNLFTKNELLIKILRIGVLFHAPFSKLQSYLQYTAQNIESIIILNDKHANFLYSCIAKFNRDSSREERNKWIEIVDNKAKEYGQEAERANAKLIKAIIAFDHKDCENGKRYLNEAEHLVHRSSWKQIVGRNVWISICEFRTITYAVEHLSGSVEHDDLQFSTMQHVVNDSAKHRHDSAVISIEMSAIKNFAFRKWDESFELFNRAMNYRSDTANHPMFIINKFFCELLKVGYNKKVLKSLINQLIESKEPFYSSVGVDLLEQSELYFKKRKKQSFES
jgi:hypothetical protein